MVVVSTISHDAQVEKFQLACQIFNPHTARSIQRTFGEGVSSALED
jgi:hypothetical protein